MGSSFSKVFYKGRAGKGEGTRVEGGGLRRSGFFFFIYLLVICEALSNSLSLFNRNRNHLLFSFFFF